MRDMALRLSVALAGRYSIERELGRGGMATVFLARDLRHDRPVALKVLHPEIASGLAAERFEREVRLAARLQHPHILSVFDSGEAPGPGSEPNLLWFTMPYVEGESLRDRLNRERQLRLEEAVRIAREVADGLDYAHRHGVVHRDIKPENILLSEGHALVADFGVARALSGEAGSGSAALTATGVTVGTVSYMSPEQASGEPDIDARSDQYALGCVLYEMLSGEPPFTGPTAQAVITRRFLEEPRALRLTRPGVPPAIERAVATALARVPVDRFPSVADFARALDAPGSGEIPSGPVVPPAGRRARRVPLAAIFVLGLLIGVGGLFAWRWIRSPGGGTGGPLMLAVLPFENRGDSADAYFADGMTDEVRAKLAGLPGFQVIARASSAHYHGTSKPLREVAQELGVRYLLTATVQWIKAGDASRVQIRPELVEMGRGGAMVSRWSEAFNAPITDLFQVQGDIAGRVASALRVAIAPSRAPALAEAPTRNLAAYDEFLRGEQAYLGSSGPVALGRALDHYERAIALDSSFARAWVRIAQVSTSLYFNSAGTAELARAAREGAERVLALAPELPEAHLAMGHYRTLVEGDYDRAIEAFRAGLALDPAHPELLGSIGLAEQGRGNLEAAIDYMRRGLALDPRSLLYIRRITRALNYARRFDEAEAMSRRALELGANDASSRAYASSLRLSQGDLAGARAVFRGFAPQTDSLGLLAYWAANWTMVGVLDDQQKRLVQAMPPARFANDRGNWAGTVAVVSHSLGETAQARAYADSARPVFEQRIGENPRDPANYTSLATLLGILGRGPEVVRLVDQALSIAKPGDLFITPIIRHGGIVALMFAREYERALDQVEILVRQPYQVTPAWLRVDPTFDPVRGHPRFQKLLAEP